MNRTRSVLLSSVLLATCACSGDPTSQESSGTAVFTSWGEEFIEHGIPAADADQDGFVDGWTVRFDKFLVNIHELTVADAGGRIGAQAKDTYFVDHTRPGKKELVGFTELETKAWEQVSFQIKPAALGAVVVAGDAADLTMMIDNGYSIYVAGQASNGETTKTFRWGFATGTQYSECRHEVDGKTRLGIVVSSGSSDVSELTIHGDHLFYDRLEASPDPVVATSLRFDEIARADDAPTGNADGEVALEELGARPIDVTKYDPSGLRAPTLGAFVTALSRTIGHFRGEGECTVYDL